MVLQDEGIVRNATTPLRGNRVRLDLGGGDVSRVDHRCDQNVPRFHFRGLHTIDLDDVISESCLDYRAKLSRTQREHHRFELRDETAAATAPAEVAAELLGAWIHRLALGDLLEVAALSDFDE